jgi:hypothetical protein
MGMRRHAKRIAAGASVALATSGLSNCRDGGGGGVIDPAVPPLECGTVNAGQTLTATASLDVDAGTVDVAIGPGSIPATWQVEEVTNVTGASVVSTRLPTPHSVDSLGVVLRFDTDSTTRASFTVVATFFGPRGEECSAERTFVVTRSAGDVQVSLRAAEPLPLAARQRAAIVFAGSAGNVVELVADSEWQAERDLSWAVNAGTLDRNDGPVVRWTLPPDAGIYQAELVVDYAAAGLAIDTLLLEVVPALLA